MLALHPSLLQRVCQGSEVKQEMAGAYNAVPKADLKRHTLVHQTLANSTRKDHLITPAFPMGNLAMDLRRLLCTQPHALSCRQVIQVYVQAGQPPPLKQNVGRETACMS